MSSDYDSHQTSFVTKSLVITQQSYLFFSSLWSTIHQLMLWVASTYKSQSLVVNYSRRQSSATTQRHC